MAFAPAAAITPMRTKRLSSAARSRPKSMAIDGSTANRGQSPNGEPGSRRRVTPCKISVCKELAMVGAGPMLRDTPLPYAIPAGLCASRSPTRCPRTTPKAQPARSCRSWRGQGMLGRGKGGSSAYRRGGPEHGIDGIGSAYRPGRDKEGTGSAWPDSARFVTLFFGIVPATTTTSWFEVCRWRNRLRLSQQLPLDSTIRFVSVCSSHPYK